MSEEVWQQSIEREEEQTSPKSLTTQFLFEKYKMKMEEIKRKPSDSVHSSDQDSMNQDNLEEEPEQQQDKKSLSSDFEVENEPPEDFKEEYFLSKGLLNPVTYNSKLYEGVNTHNLKPQRKEELKSQLPMLTKMTKHNQTRKFIFKSIDINQQIIKYEQISYVIESYQEGSHEDDQYNRATVNRTYSDFEWLFNILFESFPGTIIPSIPSRTVLAKLNISPLTASIRAQRQRGLEEFLRKLINHPKVKQCDIIEKFFTLSDSDFKRLTQELQYDRNLFDQKFIHTQTASGKIGEIITTNLNTSIYKLRNLIFGSNKQDIKDKQQSYEEFFTYVEQECYNQQVKIRKMKECIQNQIQRVQEYLKQYSSMASIMTELERDYEQLEEVSQKCDHQSSVFKELSNKMNFDTLYILEQCMLDLEVIIMIIRRKQDLQAVIASEAQALANNKFTDLQKDQVNEQLTQHQKILAELLDNFKPEFEYFCQTFNDLMNKIFSNLNNLQIDLAQQTYQLWNY